MAAKTNRSRYGMAARTIRYWKDDALWFRLHVGSGPVRSRLVRLAAEDGPVRDLAHAAIAAAAILPGGLVRDILKGRH